ncbi:hypothetical protein SmJEL517_g01456 [Synchytrium microbalum]|uniref:Uncharacterized protein n=1 Tax=Synchytrium microbalum TaxID=1806994 RepID=A0A507CEA8_9FUNG|nr:uncharacterized protein SmJEL517_g01456 [Synchytrium microbalum]TPX36376.1 hypothetical protein SmJEL517_g01456 [Synchytrium microbalum]
MAGKSPEHDIDLLLYSLVANAEVSLNLYLQVNPIKLSGESDADVAQHPLAVPLATPIYVPDATSNLLEALKKVEAGRASDGRSQLYAKQAHALLARIDSITGEYSAVVNRLSAQPMPELQGLPDTYTRVMVIMAHFLHGQALELLRQDKDAIDIYTKAISKIESQYTDAAASKPDEIDQWTKWVENIVYHHAMLCVRHAHLDQAQKSLQLYLRFLAPVPDTYLPGRRIAICRQYLTLITTNLAKPLSGYIHRPSVGCGVPVDIQAELARHLPTYERLVTALLPFPKGENETPIEKGRAQRVAQAYDWWVMADSGGGDVNEAVGDVVERHYRLIETLYRGTKHTFQSLRLFRYLSHTFSSLLHAFGDNMSRDEKREAQAAVESYLFIFNTRHGAAIDLERKRREDAMLVIRRASTIGRGSERKSAEEKRKSMERRMMAATLEVGTEAVSTERVARSVESLKVCNGHSSPSLTGLPAGSASTLPDPDAPIVVETVDGETIADVLGVLISGMRILLSTVEGDEKELKKAVEYGRRALDLTRHHSVKDRPLLIRRAQQWLGVSLGELALEVRDSAFRRQCQAEALEALQDAASMFGEDDRAGWDVLYQLALQAAEVGEIEQAFDAIQLSLTFQPTHIPSWNLLALLLSSKKSWDDGIRVLENGWTHCVNALVARARAARKLSSEVPEDAAKRIASGAPTVDIFSWDWVDSADKEELISLKLTSLALEAARFGPKAALDSVQSIFTLYRKLFGYVVAGMEEDDDMNRSTLSTPAAILGQSPNTNSAVSPSHSPSATMSKQDVPLEPLSLPKALSPFRFHTRGASTTASSSTSPPGATPSSAHLPALYRFRQYDLLIQLWLSAASLYREIEAFSEASQAVDTAEHVAEVVSMIDGRTAEMGSGRLFGAGSVHQVMMDRRRGFGLKKRKGLFALSPKTFNGGSSSTDGLASGESYAIEGRWKGASDAVRRMLADVVFESAMLRHAKLVSQQRAPVLTRAHKYLSPVAQVEAARSRGRRPVIPKSASTFSLASMYSGTDTPPYATSPILPTPPPLPTAPTANSSTSPYQASTMGTTSSKGSSYDLRSSPAINNPSPLANLSNANTSNSNTSTGPSPGESIASASSRPLTLDSVIQDLHLATLLDDDHLPSRVCLALLYATTQNHSLASSILERAVKRGKARGCGGGQSGVSSVYGGNTAAFGWESWRALGLSLQKVGRLEEAKTSLMFAVGLERVGFVRGAELLNRVVY